MTRRQEAPPKLSDTELGQLPTFGDGMSVVRLEDGSAWVRIGEAIMVRLDLVHWSPLAEAGIKPGSIAPRREAPRAPSIAVRVRPSAPRPERAKEPEAQREEPGPERRYWSRRPTDPAVVERARELIEDRRMTPAAVARKLDKSEGSIANWVQRYRWLTPARWRKAHRLIHEREYSAARAAAAVDVDVDKLKAALASGEPPARLGRQPGESQRRGRAGAVRTIREKCPHCRGMTHQNPCHNCMEKR